ncbi:terpene synthase family protein [Streptomyces coerulescens]|uniref:Terpene synthase n=1 Tax=Streptomyces coerulescens TaxID=29304 RepID=A0ABW0CMH6_STRCD
MLATIPTYPEPTPPTVSPYTQKIEEYARSLGESLGLAETHGGRERLEAGYGHFVAWTYPEASFRDLCLCAEWLFFTFILDDLHTLKVYDTPGAWAPVHRRLMDIINTGKDPAPEREQTPFTQALTDLSVRTGERLSPTLRGRLNRHLDLFFQGFAEESENRFRGTPPGMDSFTQTRRLSVGMEFGFDLVELSLDTEVPEDIYETSLFREIIEAASDVVAWQNDLHSVHLDNKRGDFHNVVIVMQHAAELSLQEAIQRAVAKVQRRVSDFLAAEERLLPFLKSRGVPARVREQILKVTAGMRQWTNGCLEWYGKTTRYTIPATSGESDQQHAHLQMLLPSPEHASA